MTKPAIAKPVHRLNASRVEQAGWILLLLAGLVAVIMRFVGTDRSPPGFYVDEAAISAQVVCLAQSGHTLNGDHWPLVTPVLGDGYSTLAWQAPAAAWTKLAGDSIAAMRGFAAVTGALCVVGIFLAALAASGSKAVAVLAATSAAISPWAFQFSRIAWDPAIAPLYLSWAVAALFFATTSPSTRPRWAGWAAILAAAALFAAACLSYPPLRLQLPLVLLVFFVWKRQWVRAHGLEAAAFVAAFLTCSAQLWFLTASGTIQARFDKLSVFGASHWADEGVTSRPMIVAHGTWLFAKNLLAHFSPSYLLVSGDANLRHSTQAFGVWSWLDALALILAVALLVRRRERPSGWVSFAAFGYFAGVIPAALTWEGVPHSLRSIGALPFLSLLVGGAIGMVAERLDRVRRFVPLAAGVAAVAYVVTFLPVFFVDYRQRAYDAFQTPVAEQLSRPEVARMLVMASEEDPAITRDADYPLLALQYYELHARVIHCGGDFVRPRG